MGNNWWWGYEGLSPQHIQQLRIQRTSKATLSPAVCFQNGTTNNCMNIVTLYRLEFSSRNSLWFAKCSSKLWCAVHVWKGAFRTHGELNLCICYFVSTYCNIMVQSCVLLWWLLPLGLKTLINWTDCTQTLTTMGSLPRVDLTSKWNVKLRMKVTCIIPLWTWTHLIYFSYIFISPLAQQECVLLKNYVMLGNI